jgi:hypothetical protein
MTTASVRVRPWTALVALCCVNLSDGRAGEADLAALRNGVSKIAAPGVPGPLCVFGPKAFPVVVGGVGGGRSAPVVAAAHWGKGRVVAFGHTGYVGRGALEAGDTGRLMLNAVRWAGGKEDGENDLRVLVLRAGQVLEYLRSKGLSGAAGRNRLGKLNEVDVLCANPNSLRGDAELATVAQFVQAGGGLVLADLGWGWLQLHPGRNLLEHHPGNRLLAPAGIVWADGHLKRTADVGFDAQPLPSLTHAGEALDALVAERSGKGTVGKREARQAIWTVSLAARSVPPGDALFLPRLRELQKENVEKALPRPDKALTMHQPLARVLLTLQMREILSLPPDKVKAHPAAEAFPGAVSPDASRVTEIITIDTAVPAWHSTGLYAAPGEVITVVVPKKAAGRDLFVRIGAHNDRIWHHDAWRRCPEICRRFKIQSQETQAANAFGGLLYIEVPGGCKLGTLSVQIKGAVPAPFYRRGETALADWKSIRQRPAPWAELAGKRVILTLPARVVRDLDNPDEIMAFWDDVLDACAELATIPLNRPRPERYVCDTQISAGYMHSGYPIMTLLDVAPVMVDKAKLVGEGHGGVWGLYHEMGHNHQSGLWTFGGTVEVTVNLFTLYVLDTVCGTPPSKHPRVSGKAREKKIKRYLKGGPDFDQWKRDPFLALMMYVQLQEAFGWDAFKKVFAEYRRLPGGERPRSDAAKRDQWLIRFSRIVGRDLGPFFQAWGVPTSEKARAAVADLPDWLPPGFPPK